MGEVKPKRTVRPLIAGLLEILASFPYFLASVMFYLFPTQMHAGSIYKAGQTTEVWTQVWAPVGLVIWLPFALPLLAGGICSLLRKGWDMAFIGPFVPLVLTAFSWSWGNLGTTAFGSLFVFAPHAPAALRPAVASLFLAIMIAAPVLVFVSRSEFPHKRPSSPYHYSA